MAKQTVQTPQPLWANIAGAAFGLLTLLFLMALVILSMYHETPQTTLRILVGVFAFGAALSAGFIGGNATFGGTIVLPLFGKGARFQVVGGIAVFFLAAIFGWFVFVPNGPVIQAKFGAIKPERDDGKWVLTVPFTTQNVTSGTQLEIVVAEDAQYQHVLNRLELTDSTSGTATIKGIKPQKSNTVYLQLIERSPTGASHVLDESTAELPASP